MAESKSQAGYDMDSVAEGWESRLTFLLQRNQDELLSRIELLLDGQGSSGYEQSERTPSQSSFAVPAERELFAPSNADSLLENPHPNGECETAHEQIAELPANEQAEKYGTSAVPAGFAEQQEGDRTPSPHGDARARFSMTSLSSHEEKSFRDNLITLQRAMTYDLTRSRSNLMARTWRTTIKELVQSWRFEAFFACAILSNSILIGIQINDSALHPHEPSSSTFFIIEQVYASLFLVELILRVLAEGKRFFWSSPDVGWNYLDILIIVSSIITVSSELAEQSLDGNLSGNVRIIRILRVTRVMRVVRIVKVLRFIRALRSLVFSIFSTMKVLMWSVILLLIIIYVFAIVFTDVTTSYTAEFADAGQVDAQAHFNSLERSMLTLFHCISNGVTWGVVADSLNTISRVWGYLLLLYISFCLFTVLNVMTAVFCQSAIESAERDQELMVQAAATTKQQQVDLFMSVFEGIQEERRKDGLEGTNLTFPEFEDLFQQPSVGSFLQSLDLEKHDAWTLFKLMDTSGNGDIDATEFVEGCMKLKGPARSIDVAIMMQEHKRLRKKILSISCTVSEIHALVSSSQAQAPRRKLVPESSSTAKPTPL